jgi:hypothetical protein
MKFLSLKNVVKQHQPILVLNTTNVLSATDEAKKKEVNQQENET